MLPALLAVSCRGGSASDRKQTPAGASPRLTPSEFTATITHPLFPLSSIPTTVFEGEEREPRRGTTIRTRAEKRVLGTTSQVAGVEVAVVEVKEYEDGELVERTLDYFAQHRDGSVWYLGERVDEYEDGKVVGHEGQWLAGEKGASPGLFMPAEPKVGQTFEQERAPGVAEDRSTVVSDHVSVTTPAGSFTDCIKTEDFAPLDKVTELKHYCPGVGLVREEFQGGTLDLVRYR